MQTPLLHNAFGPHGDGLQGSGGDEVAVNKNVFKF